MKRTNCSAILSFKVWPLSQKIFIFEKFKVQYDSIFFKKFHLFAFGFVIDFGTYFLAKLQFYRNSSPKWLMFLWFVNEASWFGSDFPVYSEPILRLQSWKCCFQFGLKLIASLDPNLLLWIKKELSNFVFEKNHCKLTTFYRMILVNFLIDFLKLFMQQFKFQFETCSYCMKLFTFHWLWNFSSPLIGPKMRVLGSAIILTEVQNQNW